MRESWDLKTRKVICWLSSVGVVGASALIGLMLVILVNIVSRLFGRSITGTYELCGVVIVVAVSFALVYAGLSQRHVVIDIVVRRLSQRSKVVLRSLTSLIGLGVWAAILWMNARTVYTKALIGADETEVLRIPYLPFRCVWLLALLLFCLVLWIDLYKAVSEATKK